MVEGGGLLNRCAVTSRTVGSNPTPSATRPEAPRPGDAHGTVNGAAARRKFSDPLMTADGRPRAAVAFAGLSTLWLNTGTLCNLSCKNCYIESSPRNDRLAYLTLADVRPFLDEIAGHGWPTLEVGFTGGEPFMNPEIAPLLEEVLGRGFRALVLTNAMRPMAAHAADLLRLRESHGKQLALRVSVDHYSEALHALERGARSWRATLDGLLWLHREGFEVAIAGRTCWGEDEAELRRGYAALFHRLGLDIDAEDPAKLVLFPEMADETRDLPEIGEDCWERLGVQPAAMMCADSRMIAKRKGADRAVVLSCTLIPYDDAFEMGTTLAQSFAAVRLNHPHCARFCVLGGGSCSA